MSGFVKIHRKIKDWEWYCEPNTLRVFFHLIINASFEDNFWQGREIKKGQLVTGRKRLANELGLSERQIRTSLNRLKSTNEITIKSTNKFSIITICKWMDYQGRKEDERPTERPTKRPTIDQQTTTTKEGKERKEEKNSAKILKMVPPSSEEVYLYAKERGRTDLAKLFFEYYNAGDWHDKHCKPITNWKQTFIAWESRNPMPSKKSEAPNYEFINNKIK